MIKDMKLNSLQRTISTGKGGRATQRSLSESNRKYIYIGGYAIMDDIHVSTDAKVQLCNDIPIRLSKRMSELGICSRREAAAILKSAQECSNISMPLNWKMRVVMICHDERDVIVTYVSACGVKAVKRRQIKFK